MNIYTRTGDGGETSLYGGERRPKCDLRIAAYGEVDELQAIVGVAMAHAAATQAAQGGLQDVLETVQEDLFVVCSELARTSTDPRRKDPVLTDARVKWLEDQIDILDGSLPPLTAFIMQGGSLAGSHLHLARAVCRRAERGCISLARTEKVSPTCVRYLNRLSDLLFVAARWANRQEGKEERAWRQR